MNIRNFLFSELLQLQPDSAKYKQLCGLIKFLENSISNFQSKKISEIDYTFCKTVRIELINYDHLAINSKFVYFNVFKSMLEEMYKHKYTPEDYSIGLTSLKQEDVVKLPISHNNISLLFDSPGTNKIETNNPLFFDKIKDMALISLYTGMRFGDIQNISFPHNLMCLDNSFAFNYIQEKTKKNNIVSIHQNIEHLITKYSKEYQPFLEVDYHRMQYPFNKWVGMVDETITFHSFRHTFAMTLYDNDVDILTISALLGHKKVDTTQKYIRTSNSRIQSAISVLNF